MLRDLSLHILDLIENSTRAGSSRVVVSIALDVDENRLKIVVDDNGPGLAVAAEVVLDPFYTTKGGKRTGLGLPLFRGAAQQAGGDLTLSESPLGGLRVTAIFALRHIDLAPMGDLAATISTVVCTHPNVAFECHLAVAGKSFSLRTDELREALPEESRNDISVAQIASEAIATAIGDLGMNGELM